MPSIPPTQSSSYSSPQPGHTPCASTPDEGGAFKIERTLLTDIFYGLDSNGHDDWFYSLGGGSTFPPVPFLSGGVFVAVSNVPSTEKILGQTGSVGGTVIPIGMFFALTVEIDKIPDSTNNKTYTAVSLGVSASFPPSPLANAVYATYTTTKYLRDAFK